MNFVEKVSCNNGESKLSTDVSAMRMGTTREASKHQSQRSFLFLQCVIWRELLPAGSSRGWLAHHVEKVGEYFFKSYCMEKVT